MGERSGEVRPEKHLTPSNQLMPEPKGQFRDDLRGVERLPFRLHPADRDVLVRMGMTTDTAGVAAQLSSVVKNLVPSLPLFALTQG